MKMRFTAGVRGGLLAAAVLLGTTVPSSAGHAAVRFFTGGGFGPTPGTAIQAAIWDAEASAGGEGLYTCELVGEPTVFPQNRRPKGGPAFTAEATLGCTP